MAGTHDTNPEFALRGINHLALVCRDMQETVEFYTGVLGMKLVKTWNTPMAVSTFSLTWAMARTPLPSSGFRMPRKASRAFPVTQATMTPCAGRGTR